MAEEHPEDLKDRGNECVREGRFGAAVELYTRALALDRTNHVYYCNRAVAYSRMGNHASALADANSAIEAKRDHGKAYNIKGSALLALGRIEDALSAFQAGSEQDGSNSNLRENIAVARRMIAARDAPAASASAPPLAAGGSPAPLIPAALLDKISLAASVAVLLMTLLFALPLGLLWPTWNAISARIYTAILITIAVSYLLHLFKSHGRPQFNAEYAMRVMNDPVAHLAVLPVVFLTTRPMLIALIPVASLQVLTALDWVYAVSRSAAPPVATALGSLAMVVLGYVPSPSHRPWSAMSLPERWRGVNERVMQTNALVEVMIGIMLIVELLTPSRSIMALVLVWQTLQMRFMSSQHTRAAFTTVDARITTLTTHRMCPSVINKGYVALRGLLRSQVKTPEEMQAEAARAAAGGAEEGAGGGGIAAGISAAMRNCVIM